MTRPRPRLDIHIRECQTAFTTSNSELRHGNYQCKSNCIRRSTIYSNGTYRMDCAIVTNYPLPSRVLRSLNHIASDPMPARHSFPLNTVPGSALWTEDLGMSHGTYQLRGTTITFFMLGHYRPQTSAWLAGPQDIYLLTVQLLRNVDEQWLRRRWRERGEAIETATVPDAFSTLLCPVRSTGRLGLYERAHITNDSHLFDIPLEISDLSVDDILLVEFNIVHRADTGLCNQAARVSRVYKAPHCS